MTLLIKLSIQKASETVFIAPPTSPYPAPPPWGISMAAPAVAKAQTQILSIKTRLGDDSWNLYLTQFVCFDDSQQLLAAHCSTFISRRREWDVGAGCDNTSLLWTSLLLIITTGGRERAQRLEKDLGMRLGTRLPRTFTAVEIPTQTTRGIDPRVTKKHDLASDGWWETSATWIKVER